MTTESDDASWAALAAAPSVAVVGLGGAGCEAVQDLLSLGIPGVQAFAINTDAKQLLSTGVEHRILLGQRELRGRGSAGDRSVVLRAAEDARDELVRRLRPFEIVFLLAGLGGGTGSALLPFLSRHLRATNTLPVPVVFLPFHVELETNAGRRENVEATVDELERSGGLVVAFANEKLRRFASLPIQRAFQVRNAYLHSMVSSLVDMIDHPSQISVDLSTLKSHLRASGLSTLIVGEYHIAEPERLVHQALSETLLDYHLSPKPSALVHLDGGSNMTLQTLDRVLTAVRQRLGDPRQLAFGTRVAPEPREVVRLTAVIGGLRSRTMRDALSRGRTSGPLPAR
ncbi:cell division protein FtsZ [mine drainage metagenome]|uniref:Cell division protein FtsZ n=1 Tax=mine drainage metagenome TaxID=410659 RepID=T0ZSL8_9ZZZZ